MLASSTSPNIVEIVGWLGLGVGLVGLRLAIINQTFL